MRGPDRAPISRLSVLASSDRIVFNPFLSFIQLQMFGRTKAGGCLGERADAAWRRRSLML
jgi:hypothetical protein